MFWFGVSNYAAQLALKKPKWYYHYISLSVRLKYALTIS